MKSKPKSHISHLPALYFFTRDHVYKEPAERLSYEQWVNMLTLVNSYEPMKAKPPYTQEGYQQYLELYDAEQEMNNTPHRVAERFAATGIISFHETWNEIKTKDPSAELMFDYVEDGSDKEFIEFYQANIVEHVSETAKTFIDKLTKSLNEN